MFLVARALRLTILIFPEIAKYYGESTPMGLEFQFRGIKKEAKALREACDNGESPLSTRKTTAAAGGLVTPKSGTKRKTKAAVSGSSSTKRAKKECDLSDSDDSGDVNYETLDVEVTPTRPRKTKSVVPAEAKANSHAQTASALTLTPAAVSPPTYTPSLTMGRTPDQEEDPEVTFVKHFTGAHLPLFPSIQSKAASSATAADWTDSSPVDSFTVDSFTVDSSFNLSESGLWDNSFQDDDGVV